MHRVHPNKSPWKIWEKIGAWAYPGTAQIFWVPHIVSGIGKATNFKFCTHIHRIDRNKSPLKISAKVAVGVLRDSRKFSEHPHRAYLAVIFAVAQLSCDLVCFANHRAPFVSGICNYYRTQCQSQLCSSVLKGAQLSSKAVYLNGCCNKN